MSLIIITYIAIESDISIEMNTLNGMASQSLLGEYKTVCF
jgi:hypothetical protein